MKNNKSIKNFLIKENETIKRALFKMSNNMQGICFVTSNNKKTQWTSIQLSSEAHSWCPPSSK